jgi:hypothetical protein
VKARTSAGYTYSAVEVYRIWLKYYDAAFAVHGDAELAEKAADQSVEVVFSRNDAIETPQVPSNTSKARPYIILLKEKLDRTPNLYLSVPRSIVHEVLQYVADLEKLAGVT